MEGTQFYEATVVKSLCVCVLAGWQRMEVMLPYTTNRILNVEEAGGKLLPRWFGAANFVEVPNCTLELKSQKLILAENGVEFDASPG